MFIYIMRCGEFVKVGIARNVKIRLSNIQSSTPYQVQLVKSFYHPYARKREHEIHTLFMDYHVRGEWFKITEDKLAELLLYI